MIAWYAAEVSNHRSNASRHATNAHALRLAEEERSRQLDAVLSSTSWRTTLPIRAARRPGLYLQRLLRG
jgi:hypothetical protein